MKVTFYQAIVIIFFLYACSPEQGDQEAITAPIDTTIIYYDALKLESLVLPPGFNIDVFARAEGARSMAQGDD